MKKENRKMAQQRRAEARAREIRNKKMRKIGINLLIIACFIAVFIGIIASGIKKVQQEKAANAENTETIETTVSSDAAAAEPVLNTEEGLAASDGDTVNIAFTGYLDGEAFDGGSSDSYDLELGSDSFIDGFEDGIIGHTVGETFDLNLTFPENYGNSDLAGQDVVFTVTLNGIYE